MKVDALRLKRRIGTPTASDTCVTDGKSPTRAARGDHRGI